MQDRPLRVKVNFAAVNPDVFLTSLNLFIRYADGVIDVRRHQRRPRGARLGHLRHLRHHARATSITA